MDEEISMPKSEELRQLVRANEKLGKLIELNVDKRDSLELICEYKHEQKNGDIKFRKLAEKQNRQSAMLHIVSISIACAAFYISVAGIDSAFVVWLKGWL